MLNVRIYEMDFLSQKQAQNFIATATFNVFRKAPGVLNQLEGKRQDLQRYKQS